MFLSVFDIFKIGVGPSSSHTMGPMTAAARFVEALRDGVPEQPVRIACSLHGSLAFTGKGHGTDRAVILGLSGLSPDTIDPETAEQRVNEVRTSKTVAPPGLPVLAFDPKVDLIFDHGPALSGHPNGLILRAFADDGGACLEEIFYSIGGGFVVTELELTTQNRDINTLRQAKEADRYPYPFGSAAEMLEMGRESGLTVAAMKRANEQVSLGEAALNDRLDGIRRAMDACIQRGLRLEGNLPGGLHVKRRAKAIRDQLEAEKMSNSTLPHVANDWLAVYAMAVNEENAAGGRVVTAPTNGAAGVIPAVLRYCLGHCPGVPHEAAHDFLLVAAAIGGLIKFNASISGAEVGCQGEVGSAAAMAAAGFCAAMGGSNEQVENAAEIALEHHLGMTCDPVNGLVQVPCIERNGLGAIKAVSAASLALRGDGTHFMPLDHCIEAMRQTGLEMNSKYKETSTGGLAVNVPAC
ncbi:L-serine ammonia-lyase [Magnetospira sp. QH-2]|uniref:L-serine ammonia-lyase n=1 Tax=Magnetospira sp. (strain QH-2) TaxID=1288970 RepID=UPI0003E81ABF|nr:L-serine ammonia-lyase [Magnetospira sp. QH-2]CCQ74506.1 L-serine dehydratase [Magnetospira sp. QH-2]